MSYSERVLVLITTSVFPLQRRTEKKTLKQQSKDSVVLLKKMFLDLYLNLVLRCWDAVIYTLLSNLN